MTSRSVSGQSGWHGIMLSLGWPRKAEDGIFTRKPQSYPQPHLHVTSCHQKDNDEEDKGCSGVGSRGTQHW